MDSFRPDILAYLNELRHEIEESLDSFSEQKTGTPKRLSEAMRYSLLAPGKRTRPLLVLVSGDLCGAPRQQTIPAACAIEMIHAYSLIHDDLPAMDDDELRRGRPTCHVQFDEPTAILAGDALLTLAFETLSHRISDKELAAKCCGVLAEAAGAAHLVGGQADDIAAVSNPETTMSYEASLKFLESIHLRKTGALLRASLQLGGILGHATPEQTDGLIEYGINFGLAFQITDDLLDWIGDEYLVGKPVKRDKDRRLTFPGLLGVDESRCEAAEKVQKAIFALDAFKPLIESQPTNPRGLSRQMIFDTLTALARYLVERKN
ncbi:MAG: polyprenyl synthetase family protein [Thermoguttaceae bacterium]